MNASQYEEVKDGARGVKGHAETKPKMAFSPSFFLLEESRESRIDMEVMFVGPSSPRSLDNNQVPSLFPVCNQQALRDD